MTSSQPPQQPPHSWAPPAAQPPAQQPQQPYPQAQYPPPYPGYPAYPGQGGGYQPPGPPPRRRTGLIVGVVVSVVVFLVAAIGLVVFYTATAGSDDDGGGDTTAAGDDAPPATSQAPAMSLPAGCELFPREQAVPHLPGELQEPMQDGPTRWADGQTQSTCDWLNDPSYAGQNGLPNASLRIRAMANASEELAKDTMELWAGKCDGSNPANSTTSVTGADEACLTHDTYREEGSTRVYVESAGVVARHKTLVVEVRYHKSWAELTEVEPVAHLAVSAVLTKIMASQ